MQQEPTNTQRSRSVPRNNSLTVLGVPIVAFITSIIATGLFFIVEIVIVSSNCPFKRNVIYYFVSVFSATIAIVAMLTYHIFYRRAKPDCFSLLLTLIYAGSAALVLFNICHSATTSLCVSAQRQSLIPNPPSSNPAEYSIWFLTGIGVVCQIIGHFFFA